MALRFYTQKSVLDEDLNLKGKTLKLIKNYTEEYLCDFATVKDS